MFAVEFSEKGMISSALACVAAKPYRRRCDHEDDGRRALREPCSNNVGFAMALQFS